MINYENQIRCATQFKSWEANFVKKKFEFFLNYREDKLYYFLQSMLYELFPSKFYRN